MDRVILHSDINNCFASIELLYRPELRGRPVAVCGEASERHGIVLSKDELAKKAGVKTGEAIWQARQKCPELTIVEPHFDRYIKYSRIIREIYADYTDMCEPFGIDESWLDITGCHACPDGPAAARDINQRVKRETGLTVSVGVSWNKVLAKLGSDYKKPDAVTVIDRSNFQRMVWPLPASDLLMVGRSTSARLRRMGICTIGDIARTEPDILGESLGKSGYMLHAFANGLDASPVRRADDVPEAKSIGNSTTTARDITGDREARLVLLTLAESVGARLRDAGLKCRTVEVSVRRADDLDWRSHRMRLRCPTDITEELLSAALSLYLECRLPGEVFRSAGLRCTELVRADTPEQMDLFCDYVNRDRSHRIDCAMDHIRGKYGFASICRGAALADVQLGALNAKEEHTVHPVGFVS
jgi:DNA polymerase-4